MRTGFFMGTAVLVGVAVAAACSSSDTAAPTNNGDGGQTSSASSGTVSSSSSSSSGSSGTTPAGDDDGGTDSGTDASAADAGDAGDASVAQDCQPRAPTPYTFKSAARYQNKCTSQQVKAILDGCVFGGTGPGCFAAKSAAPDCYGCMIGTPQDPTAHPLLTYSVLVPPIASTGICMAAYANDGTNATDCSAAFGDVEICAYEACVPSCLEADSPTLNSCLQAAVGTVCTTGATSFNSTACKQQYNGTKYGYCANNDLPDGGTVTNDQYDQLLALGICGPPPDAGH
jgi:hypothetical protein